MLQSVCLFLILLFLSFKIHSYKLIDRTLKSDDVLNNRPIVGILSQELDEDFIAAYPNGTYKSYIAASYVKYIEGSGARVVPIFINQSDAYYDEITSSVNGVLMPGGAASFDIHANGYSEAFYKIYHLAMQKNLPLWGTCQGFEVLAIVAADGHNLLTACNSHNVSYNLHFEPNYRHSRVYGQAPEEIIRILRDQNVTANSHSWCLTAENMTKFGIFDDWNILSTNKDEDGFLFVSTIESKKYPMWGVQFHPEKNNYEWHRNGYAHWEDAVKISQYFANFFVNETRKNHNSFKTEAKEQESLIYNYPKEFTSIKKGISFEESYLFKI